MVILSTTFTKSSVLVMDDYKAYGYSTSNMAHQFFIASIMRSQAVN